MMLFAILIYLFIVALGAVCLWVSYQVSARGRLSFIRGGANRPLTHAELIAKRFAIMAASAGIVVLLFAITIPLYGIRWGTWHFYLGVVAGIWGAWRQIFLMRYAKLLALTRQSTGTQTNLPSSP